MNRGTNSCQRVKWPISCFACISQVIFNPWNLEDAVLWRGERRGDGMFHFSEAANRWMQKRTSKGRSQVPANRPGKRLNQVCVSYRPVSKVVLGTKLKMLERSDGQNVALAYASSRIRRILRLPAVSAPNYIRKQMFLVGNKPGKSIKLIPS